ncbi:MAG: RluA family pseudouridine synthase [Chloroflexi bacterium]|jgi:23S rRNA pseudouridine1911/1915/1917 synthase|nr:RluA family pseudouridine synthase [Chloroflexota bacterium]MBT7082122.1 RluA family pseudouridine synthase [Chloroflexota bacterium]MBT7289635.1 RluA family pseudouridine synthase [Chloroflexota bacterium]
MSKIIDLNVDGSRVRLDIFLANQCGISRSYAQKLIADGRFVVNGDVVKSSYKLDLEDKVSGEIPDPEPLEILPENIPLQIVYEDSDILVVDKPAGLIVHPAPGNWEHTLVNALLAYCPDLAGIGGKVRPGIVHRLDKNTSGLIMVAKNDGAHHSLSQQLKERLVKKRYLTLLVGQLAPRQGAVDAQLGRDPRNRKKMAVVSVGREALTRYQVISYLDGYTYVEAMPETGRTHQIRVHFAAIGFPVYADAVYGNKSDLLGRHFLHAHQLGFKLPSNNEDVEFKSDLPEELKIVLDQLSAEGVA